MGRFNGHLVASYEVHCPECDKAALGLGSTQRRAADELLKNNWRRKFSRWFCSERCVELWRQETARLAAKPPAQPDPAQGK